MHSRIESRTTFEDDMESESQHRFRGHAKQQVGKGRGRNQIEHREESMETLNGGVIRPSKSEARLINLTDVHRAQEVRANTRGTSESSLPSSSRRHHAHQGNGKARQYEETLDRRLKKIE